MDAQTIVQDSAAPVQMASMPQAASLGQTALHGGAVTPAGQHRPPSSAIFAPDIGNMPQSSPYYYGTAPYGYHTQPGHWQYSNNASVPAAVQGSLPNQVLRSSDAASYPSRNGLSNSTPSSNGTTVNTLDADSPHGKARGSVASDRESFKVEDMKKVANPPNLQHWRQQLFDLDKPITLIEDEFATYFPHVDNVYSHRSTQKYRRNPYAAHYWDCRLKGRPSGTKKSTDPSKKKRNRVARDPDQCNVKIKILEFFPYTVIQVGSQALCPNSEGAPRQHDADHASPVDQAQAPFGVLPQSLQPPAPEPSIEENGVPLPLISSGGSSIPQASAAGKRVYMIQRISSNAVGQNAEPERHRHDLGYSDKIKKNSIAREALKDERERRKFQKQYHKRASGAALKTVEAHVPNQSLKLWGSAFCPFVQRVWISLEFKKVPYQYIEVDPYKKPKALLDVNPRGLVPALKHGDWACHESSVLMEYLEDMNEGYTLLPSEPKARAHSRLWADHVNRNIIPTFYHFLQAQDPEKQVAEAEAFGKHIRTLVEAAADPGPFFLGPELSFVDVVFAPWIIRLNRVLKPYRSWPDPEPGSRWEHWVNAIESCEAVQATTSEPVLYLDSYERYAENRPNTSQVADAVNIGRTLP